MLMYIDYEISFVPLLHWTPLGVSVKWEEQIWCLNIKAMELKTPVTNLYTMSSGCMDPCTFYGI